MNSAAPVPGPRPTRVADVMTKPFVSVRPHMTPAYAATRMREHGVRTAPVLTAEGRLVGVVSVSDLSAAGIGAAPDDDCHGIIASITVADVMSFYPVTVSPDADLTEAAGLMRCTGWSWRTTGGPSSGCSAARICPAPSRPTTWCCEPVL